MSQSYEAASREARRRALRASLPPAPELPASPALFLNGIPMGFAGSLLGIGGGLFATPLLHLRKNFDLKRAAGTSLVLVLATTLAATVTELFRAESPLRWDVCLALVAGAFFGTYLGFVFSESVPVRVLRVIFAVMFAFAAVRVFLGAGSEEGLARFGAGVLGAEAWVWIAIVGLAGGFVAPVLGVGGGLVMVPGLYLGAPQLSFDAARAASLAAGVFVAVCSLYFKAKAGRVSWQHGALLGVGAVLGSASSVIALSLLPELLEVARIVFALVLFGVAGRFALEVLRGPAS